MKVTAIFYSIEGEGIEIGRPEVFIRLAGCNLRCIWCDTKYSWDNGKEMNLDEIIEEISRYPCGNISITGGEPLLQKEELLELIEIFKGKNYWVQISTNGTIFDQKILELADLITMDCKCPSSGMRSDLEVLKRTKESFNSKAQFKFIISDKEDYEHAKKIISSLKALNVIFQPEWNHKKFAREMAELVKIEGLNVRIILQQQKIIWSNKRSA